MATPPGKLEQLAVQLKELSETLAKEEASQVPASRAKRVRKTLNEAYDKLRKVMDDLDPIKHPGFVFDPSNPSVAGRIVGITMIAQPRKPLANVERFYGSGVYAIYYNGDFPAYAAISKREHPIYVGKADPADAALAATPAQHAARVKERVLREAAEKIRAESALNGAYHALRLEAMADEAAKEAQNG
jgi:hypothetical protein